MESGSPRRRAGIRKLGAEWWRKASCLLLHRALSISFRYFFPSIRNNKLQISSPAGKGDGMPVAIERFSIREYAGRMRRIDMGKCWPFGREVKGCSLPPISLRKFRWWADELESERGDGEPAQGSLAEEDVYPTPDRIGGRGKQKVPKKRSIVELFAVAPQIEAVEEDDDWEDEEREDQLNGEREEVLERTEGNVGFDFVKELQERNHGGQAVIRRKPIRLKRIKKQKQKQKKITASKKVKSHRSKSPSAGIVSHISEYCSSKTKLKDPISEHTKKKRAQASKTRENLKSIRASTFPGKKHFDDCRKAPPLRSILKNRNITSNKNTTVLARSLRGHHINSSGELLKHVSFSDKEDIFGLEKNYSSKGEKHSVAINEEPQLEMENNVDVSTSSMRLADRPGSEKNHSIDLYGLATSIVDPNSIDFPDKIKNKFENSDLNKNMQMHCSLSCPMAPDSISLHCRPDSSNKKIVDSTYNDDFSSNIRNHVQKSTSKHFLGRNCSSFGSMKFMELMQASEPMFFSRNKITNEDIFSLPLNSQGELVKLDSSCKFGFNNPCTKQTFHCSLIPTHMEPMRKPAQENMKERFPRESLYAIQKQYCSSENHFTSGHNIAQLQNYEGIMEAEKLEPVHCKDPYNIQNCDFRFDRSIYHPGRMDCGIDVAHQPTMRLMGTNVTIGEISKKSNTTFDNVKVWANKKMTIERCRPRSSNYLETYADQFPEQDKLFKPSALWASQEKLLLSSRDHIPLVAPKFDLHQSQMAIGLPSTNFLHCHPPQSYLHLTQQPLVRCNSQIGQFIRYPTPMLSTWNHGQKMKRRLAEKGHEFIRPLKKAHVILPVKSSSFSSAVGRGQHNIMFHPRNIGATGVLHDHGNGTRNPNAQLQGFKIDEYRRRFINESNAKHHRHVQVCWEEKNVFKSSRLNMKPSSSNPPVYASQVGLAKLRAGAKHVIKPFRNSDYKSSKVVHSAIPLVDGNNASSRNVVSHKKLEEIYSF